VAFTLITTDYPNLHDAEHVAEKEVRSATLDPGIVRALAARPDRAFAGRGSASLFALDAPAVARRATG